MPTYSTGQAGGLSGRRRSYTREPYPYTGIALAEVLGGDKEEAAPSIVPDDETIKKLQAIEDEYDELLRQQESKIQAELDAIEARYAELDALEQLTFQEDEVKPDEDPSALRFYDEGEVAGGMGETGTGAISGPVADEGPHATLGQTGRALGKFGVGVLTGKPLQGLVSALPTLGYPPTAKDSPYMQPTFMNLVKDTYRAIGKDIPFSEQVYDTAMENFAEQTMQGIGIENPEMMEEERGYDWGIPEPDSTPYLDVKPQELSVSEHEPDVSGWAEDDLGVEDLGTGGPDASGWEDDDLGLEDLGMDQDDEGNPIGGGFGEDHLGGYGGSMGDDGFGLPTGISEEELGGVSGDDKG